MDRPLDVGGFSLAGLRVFVSHAFDDPVHEVVAALRRLGIEAVLAEAITGSEPLDRAIVNEIGRCDALLVVGRRVVPSMLVEIGIALGSRVRVVAQADLDLQLPTFELIRISQAGDSATLGRALALVSTRPEPAVRFIEEERDRPAIAPDQALAVREALRGAGSLEAVDTTRRLFEMAGARVISRPSLKEPTDPSAIEPDFVIWQDSLLASFGLPILVEVLIRPISVEGILPRLWRTLVASGGQTLIATAVTKVKSAAKAQDDSGRLVMVVPSLRLIDELERHSLSQALLVLRSKAVGLPR